MNVLIPMRCVAVYSDLCSGMTVVTISAAIGGYRHHYPFCRPRPMHKLVAQRTA